MGTFVVPTEAALKVPLLFLLGAHAHLLYPPANGASLARLHGFLGVGDPAPETWAAIRVA